MSALVVAEGVLEGLQLLNNLIGAAQSVNTAIQTAQASGQPLDLSTVLSEEAQAENTVLAAIAQAQARGD